MLIVNQPLIDALESFGFDTETITRVPKQSGFVLKGLPSHINKLWESENPLFNDLNQKSIPGYGFCITIPNIAMYTESDT